MAPLRAGPAPARPAPLPSPPARLRRGGRASGPQHTMARRLVAPDVELPGDVGFDPLELARGGGARLIAFREAEVIHARWAMIGFVGLLVPEALGVPASSRLERLDVLFARNSPGAAILFSIIGFTELQRAAFYYPGVARALVERLGIGRGLKSRRQSAEGRPADRRRRAEPNASAKPAARRREPPQYRREVYPGGWFDVFGVADTRQSSTPPPGLGAYSSWVGGVLGWLGGGWWYARRADESRVLALQSAELTSGRFAMVAFLLYYSHLLLSTLVAAP